jgi:ABC-2 type transport system ATP-binding protein
MLNSLPPGAPAILARGVVKRFGATQALAGLDLVVEQGAVLGVLGPNGAGKTTAVRILTTLLRPDSGQAEVAGFNVVTHPQEVRERIGLAGQAATVDELLSGRENLTMVGRLFRLPRADARQRATALLERFDLTNAADRPVKTYSGGMRRRLDLAASLVAQPPVLFLDEPTTGLDPRSRLDLWSIIREQTANGATVLLTTQYLDEADQFADRITVIDHGRAIAEGTSDQLKDQVGGDRLDITLAPGSDLSDAVRALEEHASGAARVDIAQRRVSVPVVNTPGLLAAVVRDLDATSAVVADLSLRRPTLDDVFLTMTGTPADADQSIAQEAA